MEYSIEELIPIVEKLTGKYTSLESSSITYETARMLMSAVLYCIEEYHNTSEYEISAGEKVDATIAYQCGYDLVISKVFQSKKIYESIIEDFNDFKCRNCRDTILKGIPQFFLRYDPKFNPQDHLLTLDYPTIKPINSLLGVNAVYQYLCNIKTEWDFLNEFDTKRVEYLLEKICIDYKNMFFDNISNAVLLTSLGCILADKPVDMLELQTTDIESIENFFENDSVDKAEQKIRMLLSKLFIQGFRASTEMEDYFLNLSREFAVRIINGSQSHSLMGVFNITNTM